jgi:hypothetical protein
MLSALWLHTGDVGRPKAATLGQLAGPHPSRPLWSWAAVSPWEQWTFPISWNYSTKFEINFSLNLNLYKFVQTWYPNQFVSSLGN